MELVEVVLKAVKKKLLLTILGLVILIIASFVIFSGGGESPYEMATVARGDLVEDVSVTGAVKPVEAVDLRFETGGTVEKVYVNEGVEVKRGTALVKLYTGKLYSQYLQAQAGRDQAKAELEQFVAGASEEERKVAEQIVQNAEITLTDAQNEAESDLNEKYDDALVYLSNASSNVNIALADLNNIEPTYFSLSTAISASFREKECVAQESYFGTYNFEGAKSYVDLAIVSPIQQNINQALAKIREATNKAKEILDYTREAMSGPTLREKVTAADKATVDSDISSINSTLTNISTAQQAISSQTVTNQVNINSAQNALDKAKDDLVKLEATPRNVDVAIYQAQLNKATASLTELGQKLNEATLRAPFDGTVTKVNTKIGEIVTIGGNTAVSLISQGNFQIEGEVPEVDIGKIEIGDPVVISLDAFQIETWDGEVAKIEPAETIIEGVVYYKITAVFNQADERLKSGMSADVSIITGRRQGVLTIPYRAINYRDDKKVVKILSDGEIKEIEVETGLKGNNGQIEITHGLEEGQEIIAFIKK